MKLAALTVRLLSVLALLPLLVWSCSDSDAPTRPIDFGSLTAIDITTPGSLVVDSSRPFTALGHFEIDSGMVFSRDIGDRVEWRSSDPAILAFSTLPGEAGLATAGARGSVTVTAEQDGVRDEARVTVFEAIDSLVIEAEADGVTAPATLASGTVLQLQALGVFADGTTQDLTRHPELAWTTSSEAIASVVATGEAGGKITGGEPGAAVIQAEFRGVPAQFDLTVTAAAIRDLAIAPIEVTLAPDTAVQLTASGTFSDGSTQDLTGQAAWSVQNTTVATVNSTELPGRVTAREPGRTDVSAEFQGLTASAEVTVEETGALASLSVTAPDDSTEATLAVGEELQLMATGTFTDSREQDLTLDVEWRSSDSNIALISPHAGREGILVANAPGEATITAAISLGVGAPERRADFLVTVKAAD